MKISPNCDPSIAKALVEVFTIMNQPRVAIKELREILGERPDDNILNLICDLHIQLSEFPECIQLLESLTSQVFPLDIESKKGYCLARLGRLAEADSCFENLLKHSVQYYDDLYLLVGGLYMDLAQAENALKFFEPLLGLERHNNPMMWFKCAKLYYDIADHVSAEEAFGSVLDSGDSTIVTQSKLFLSKIYKSRGDIEKSISILKTKQLETDENFDISDELINDLISNAKLKIEESSIKSNLHDLFHFLDNLVDIELKLELRKREDLIIGLSVESLSETIEKTVKFAICEQQYSQAKTFLLKALKLNMYKGSLRLKAKKLLSQLCVLDEDYDQALNAHKYVCEKENTESNWIVMSSLMRKAEKPQLRSWLCKVASRNTANYAVHMLLGNSYFQTGNYNLAIKQYLIVYSVDDALINLQIGLCYLFSMCSRNIQKKDEVFAKAFRYLDIYVRIRKKKNYVEAYYNLARAYHHIQYYTIATHNYEKVLLCYSRNNGNAKCANSSLGKYMGLAVKNLIHIRNSLEDTEGAELLASQWIDK